MAAGDPGAWMKELSKSWMEGDPEEAGYLYVDGHVRVYNGEIATLPRRYVSRERLCLRGTTDYWVNDAMGRPFFVVSKVVTEGLADALLTDIVPQLLLSVPQQPTAAELDNDPPLHRFVMVFDREGATHSLLSQLWQQRIGALTYRKRVRDVWPESEFIEQEVVAPGGGNARMKLSMRQTTLSAGKASIPVTEVRRLTDSGHQTAVITTATRLEPSLIASRMFSRWCQENFFAYMMQHYDIDGLIEYGVQSLPGTLRVVNRRGESSMLRSRRHGKPSANCRLRWPEVPGRWCRNPEQGRIRRGHASCSGGAQAASPRAQGDTPQGHDRQPARGAATQRVAASGQDVLRHREDDRLSS
jgi:prepilin-type processing-associated H-X9-DG protein